MAHLHIVQDDELYFSIDPYSKKITYEGEGALVLAKGDHNSEMFTFEMPRIIEGHDMMLCDRVEVHYINMPIGSTNARSSDMYIVKDLQLASDDENMVMFTWLLSENATMYVGSLNFAIRFACTTGADIDYSWRTAASEGISVIESIDNSGTIVEQQSDVLQQWYVELVLAGDSGINRVEAATEEAIERIKQVDVIVEVEQEVLDRIEAAGEEVVNEIRSMVYTGETEAVQ